MISFSSDQFDTLAQVGQARFITRLAAHLTRLQADSGAPVDGKMLAERALQFADANALVGEDTVAALAEVMLAFHGQDMRDPSIVWLREILADNRPRKARRMRECLAIELRLAHRAG